MQLHLLLVRKEKQKLNEIIQKCTLLSFQNDPSKLSQFGNAMLHGKGYDRWFDKSFTLVVTSNGRVSDAPPGLIRCSVLYISESFDTGVDLKCSEMNTWTSCMRCDFYKLVELFLAGWLQRGTLMVSLKLNFCNLTILHVYVQRGWKQDQCLLYTYMYVKIFMHFQKLKKCRFQIYIHVCIATGFIFYEHKHVT